MCHPRNAIVDTLNLILKNALEARRQEKNYVLRGSQEYLDAVARSVQAVKDLVAEGRRAISDQTMRANFNQVLDPLWL